MFIRYTFLLLTVIFAFSSMAQTPDTVIAGPYGVPRLVKNEGGQWSEPIQVFSNTDKVVYVPDITTPSWAQWHEQDFKTRGFYFTYVYTYLRKPRVTVQDIVYVDTRAQHIVVQRFLKEPLQFDLTHTGPVVRATIAAITNLVQDSLNNFHGPSMGDVRREDKALLQHNLNVLRQR